MLSPDQKASAVNLKEVSTNSVARVIVLDTIENTFDGNLFEIQQTLLKLQEILAKLQSPEGQILVQILFNQYLGVEESDEADERVLDACPECIELEDLHNQLINLLRVVCATVVKPD